MKKYNIRRCYYIDINKNLIFENVKDMISIKFSELNLIKYNKIYNKSYTYDQYSKLLLKKFDKYVTSEKSLKLFIIHTFHQN